MFNIKFLFIAILLAWILQALFNHIQVKNIQETFSHLGRKGDLLTGAQKDILRGGCIFAMVINNNGIIRKTMYMKGYTVFARFREFDRFNGKSLEEALLLCPKSSKDTLYRAVQKSLIVALDQRKNKTTVKKEEGDSN